LRWARYYEETDNFLREVAEREIEAKKSLDPAAHNLKLQRPPRRKYIYSLVYLERARVLEMAYGHPILNPRDTNVTSLEDVDEEWIRDLSAYREEVQYFVDLADRPTNLK